MLHKYDTQRDPKIDHPSYTHQQIWYRPFYFIFIRTIHNGLGINFDNITTYCRDIFNWDLIKKSIKGGNGTSPFGVIYECCVVWKTEISNSHNFPCHSPPSKYNEWSNGNDSNEHGFINHKGQINKIPTSITPYALPRIFPKLLLNSGSSGTVTLRE